MTEDNVDSSISESDSITLSKYFRLPFTCRRCVYPTCVNKKLKTVPTKYRLKLFCEYKVYIPEGCKICQKHYKERKIGELHNVKNLMKEFRRSDVDGVLKMLTQQLRYENLSDELSSPESSPAQSPTR